MQIGRKAVLVTAMAGSLLGGGALGAVIFGAGSGSAQTTSTTAPAASNGSPTAPPSGTFKPNEDPTHEKGESAQREAQENAGQVPTVP